MTEGPNRVQWRTRLSRVLFNLRWKLFGRGQSNYRCLTIRMPVSSDFADDRQHLTLRQVMRGQWR
jgi:hypothetical protein